jgi:chaperonin GroES
MSLRNEIGLELTGRRVLVRLPKIEEKTRGGIVVPSITKEREEKAQVVAILVDIADDARAVSEVKGLEPGDSVFYARYSGAGQDWTMNGVMYRVMNATDIIGRWQPGAPGIDSAFRAAQTPVEVYGTADDMPLAAA